LQPWGEELTMLDWPDLTKLVHPEVLAQMKETGFGAVDGQCEAMLLSLYHCACRDTRAPQALVHFVFLCHIELILNSFMARTQ
jgi:hypothetical protein